MIYQLDKIKCNINQVESTRIQPELQHGISPGLSEYNFNDQVHDLPVEISQKDADNNEQLIVKLPNMSNETISVNDLTLSKNNEGEKQKA